MFLLDASIQNGCALCLAIRIEDTPCMPFIEAKRRVAEEMVSPLIAHNKMRLTFRVVQFCKRSRGKEPKLLRSDRTNSGPDDEDKNNKMLLTTVDSVPDRCVFCRLRNPSQNLLLTQYACELCKYAFHVSYFTAYNHHTVLHSGNMSVCAILDHAINYLGLNMGTSRFRKRPISCTEPIKSVFYRDSVRNGQYRKRFYCCNTDPMWRTRRFHYDWSA